MDTDVAWDIVDNQEEKVIEMKTQEEKIYQIQQQEWAWEGKQDQKQDEIQQSLVQDQKDEKILNQKTEQGDFFLPQQQESYNFPDPTHESIDTQICYKGEQQSVEKIVQKNESSQIKDQQTKDFQTQIQQCYQNPTVQFEFVPQNIKEQNYKRQEEVIQQKQSQPSFLPLYERYKNFISLNIKVLQEKKIYKGLYIDCPAYKNFICNKENNQKYQLPIVEACMMGRYTQLIKGKENHTFAINGETFETQDDICNKMMSAISGVDTEIVYKNDQFGIKSMKKSNQVIKFEHIPLILEQNIWIQQGGNEIANQFYIYVQKVTDKQVNLQLKKIIEEQLPFQNNTEEKLIIYTPQEISPMIQIFDTNQDFYFLKFHFQKSGQYEASIDVEINKKSAQNYDAVLWFQNKYAFLCEYEDFQSKKLWIKVPDSTLDQNSYYYLNNNVSFQLKLGGMIFQLQRATV